MSDLLSAVDIRALAEKAGVSPTKKLGQNFLLDGNTVRSIVAKAGVAEGDVVLEVGPGLGSLTFGLLAAGADVAAIELDPVLAPLLPQTAAERGITEGRLSVMHADALQVTELPALPDGRQPTALVANLPYNVATPIVLTLLGRFLQLKKVLVMVQMEVADRLAAEPGSRIYGAPSVKASWFGNCEKAGKISRQVFWPVPNVDSALVRLTRWEDGAQPYPEGVSREEVFAAVDAAFAQRRKTLRAALAGWAGSPARAEELLRAAGIDPSRRGETLTIADFVAVCTQARKRVG
ncbi:16S rRNA (adenine(1518)-N(6)/adenine(1519)-N(6))-dimethyltransferase RsmA [Dermabacteraceae bacterium TAE3-ERU27]|nr:16S rRNA (adenine(1518)-N(6)/adenine(1519)-N(6))-dimethyltransferase RsmA [Dermabacteraceae bacterium TAE3-ERU27]